MTPTRVWTLVIIAAVCAIISWLLLRQVYSVLPALPWTGVPALLLLAAPDGSARPFTGSDDATVAITALAAAAGAWCVRVHEVPANADAVRVGQAWREAAGLAGETGEAGLAGETGAARQAGNAGAGGQAG